MTTISIIDEADLERIEDEIRRLVAERVAAGAELETLCAIFALEQDKEFWFVGPALDCALESWELAEPLPDNSHVIPGHVRFAGQFYGAPVVGMLPVETEPKVVS